MSNHDPYSDSPEPVGWIQHHQLYSSGGADIVMQSITLLDHQSPNVDSRDISLRRRLRYLKARA